MLRPRRFRCLLDKLDVQQCIDGTVRESRKVIQPPDTLRLIYFPPGVAAAALTDASLPVIISDDEFKALALSRLANHQSSSPRFLPISIPGAWGFRGTIGKAAGPEGDREVTGVIPDFDKLTWKDRKVIIAFDADTEQNFKTSSARNQLTAMLVERGAHVGSLEWAIAQGKCIDQRLAQVGPEPVLADVAAVDVGNWRTRLLRSDNGKLLPSYENARLFLEKSSEWSGVLGYNEFTGGFVIRKAPPPPVTALTGREIEDHFDTEVVCWLERRGVMARPDLVRRVVDVLARRSPFHPVPDYLDSLPPWDGTPRTETWLIDYCGVESSTTNTNHYARAVGEKFLISAVARVMNPGCKVDHTLVLEGDQGLRKSAAVRILAGEEFFTDQVRDFHSKDASMQVRGVWIVELAEIDSLVSSRSEMGAVKQFLTQQDDRFRLPYGHRVVRTPRQCTFIGTTNANQWMHDETGGRRFWPVRCRAIDLDRLRSDRDKLWAEALFKLRRGDTWWLDSPELVQDAIDEQQDRFAADAWQELIQAWVLAPMERLDETGNPMIPSTLTTDSVTVGDVLAHCLGKRPGLWTRSDENRVARVLTALGWKRHRVGPRNARQYRYLNPGTKP
jgi:predicted P-loop ATPase